ncbi:MAG: Ig-like domain-containing protein, partial [Bacteroidales bacterium]
MKRLYLALFLILMMLLCACGSKKNPTGGPEDTEKPSILSSVPAEYGDISSGIIEIDFSKAMDKSSLSNSVFFYPPIANRRI